MDRHRSDNPLATLLIETKRLAGLETFYWNTGEVSLGLASRPSLCPLRVLPKGSYDEPLCPLPVCDLGGFSCDGVFQ